MSQCFLHNGACQEDVVAKEEEAVAEVPAKEEEEDKEYVLEHPEETEFLFVDPENVDREHLLQMTEGPLLHNQG